MLTKDEIDALVSENSYYGGCINVEAFAAAVIAAHERKVLEDVEPVGYLAWRDGKPDWSEDCVCEDAVYPVDGEDRTSMAIYPATTVAALKGRISELEKDGPMVSIGKRGDGAPATATMRKALELSQMAASAEAGFADEFKSERDALAARVAELAAALLKCRDMVEHPDNVAFIDAALAAKGQA